MKNVPTRGNSDDLKKVGDHRTENALFIVEMENVEADVGEIEAKRREVSRDRIS